MYETAAMMKEMRAECPEWTRDRYRTRAAIKPAARKTAAPATKKVAAPVARKNTSRIRAKAIIASFRDTLEKTERDIIRNKQRLDQLEYDIRAMQRMGAPEGSILLMQKKKDREEVRGKIEKLQKIRDDCKKQLGMK